MRNSKFIITWLLILSTLATASEPAPRSASNGTCSLRANNTFHSIAFTTQVQDYTITGEGRTNQSYTDLSLTVESNGCLVMRFTGNISAKGVFTTKWNFGPVLGGGTLTLVTINGTTEGNLDNHRLSPFNDTAPGFHFTNAIGILPHNVPKSLASVSQVLSDAVKSTLSGCKSPDPEKTREELVRALLKRQNIFGAPGQIENTGSQSQCADCIGEAFAACAACGFACAFTPFGLGCGCIAGEPLLFTQCHNPGNGLGQGCCPVGCGDYQSSSVSRFHTNVASPDNRVSIQIVGYVALEVPSPAIAKNVVRLTPLVEISVFVVPRIRIRVLPEVAQPVALQVTSAATISAALPIRSFATRFAATLGKPAF